MKKWKRAWKRIVAIIMAILVVGTRMNISVFVVQAVENTREETQGALVDIFKEGTTDGGEEVQIFTDSVSTYSESEKVVSYPVYVQGIQVTDENAADVLGEADAGESVTYDATTATLTLNGATLTPVKVEDSGYNSYFGVYAEQELNLVLVGTNTIGGGGGSYDGGIYMKNGVLTICGEGVVTIEDGIYSGIHASEGITINSGTIVIDADDAGFCGIYSDRAIIINDGTVNVKGRLGIGADNGGTITITGGSVNARGNTFAIFGNGNVTITGGMITAEGSYQYGGGIYTDSKVVLGGDAHVKAINIDDELAIEAGMYKLVDGARGHYRTTTDGAFSFCENISCGSSYFEFVGLDHMTVNTTEETHILTCKDGCTHSVSFVENHLGGKATHVAQASCAVCEMAYGSTDEYGHYGGVATCTQQAICEFEGCGQSYGDLIPHMTDPTTGKCSGCGMDMATTTVTAEGFWHYAGTPADLMTSVKAAIAAGHTDITVTLPTDADAYWLTPVRNGILASGAADGSIHLILAGITTIPNHDEFNPATAIFGPIWVDDDGFYLDEDEIVTQLGAVSLPDATSIGSSAFSECANLKSLYAPMVQTVGEEAFFSTGLVSLELPEATTLEWFSFYNCESLTNAKLSKATSLGQQAFDDTALTYLELLAEGDIFVHQDALGYPESFAGQVDLVIGCNKNTEVTDGVAWNGFTFQSVTTSHAYNYTAEDVTITATCSICDTTSGSVTLVEPDADDVILSYNGQPQGTIFIGNIDGITPVIRYTGTEYSGVTYDSEDAPVNAGNYTASIILGKGENVVAVSVDFEITKAELTVTSATAVGRIFDGTNQVAIASIELSGIFEPDEVSVQTTELIGTIDSDNAGNYTSVILPTLSLTGVAADNYILKQPSGAVATNVTITREAAPTVDVIQKSYLYLRENTDSINITELLPTDCGTVSYGIPMTGGTVTYSVYPSVTDGILSYTVASGAIDAAGTMTVVVETQKYEDITITINLKLIDQILVSLKDGAEVTLKSNTITYGDILSKLEFNDAVFVTQDGIEIEGTLAWKNAEDMPIAGTTSAEWVFTPEDNTLYKAVKGDVEITVNKATPVVSAVPTVPDMVYSPSGTLADSELIGGNVIGVDGKSLSGTWNWQRPEEIPTVKNTGYMAVFTPSDTMNYVTITETVNVKVNRTDAIIAVETTSYNKSFGDTDFALEGIEVIGEGVLIFTVSDGKDIEGNAKDVKNILTVSKEGVATIQGTGSVIVTVSMEESANYNAAEPKQIIVNVTLADGFFVGELEEMTYTGKAIKPEVRVYDGTKEVLLQKGKDYTVTYKNNTNTYMLEKDDEGFDAKKAPRIIIKGKGNYSEKLTVYFTIQPKDISDVTDESIVVKDILLEENGKIQKKVPVITYNKKKLLGVLKPEDGSAPAKTKDFIYSYSQLDAGETKDKAFKEDGTWQILVEGTGNYMGSRYVDVVIAQKGGKMSSAKIKSIPVQEYTGTAIDLDVDELKVTAKVDGKTTTLVRDTHYSVRYKNNEAIGTATVIITGIEENGFAGSKTATFKIVGTSIVKASVTGIEPKVYNGSEQTQTMTVKVMKEVDYGDVSGNETVMKEVTLTEGTDFTVTYDKNVKVGTAKMTIEGIGAYSGTINKSFKITAYDMTGETDAAGNVKENSSLTETNGLFEMTNGQLNMKYVKGGAKPLVKLVFNGAILTEGKDYTVSYKNNKTVYTLTEGVEGYKANKAPTIIIKGKGNFKGTVSKTFVITGRTLQDSELAVTMTVNDKGVSTKKGGYISKPVLTDKDGKVLKQGKDYTAPVYTMTSEKGETINLTKNDKVMTVGTVITVTVKGLGAYAFDADEVLTASYRITAKNFGQIKAQTIQKEYTGRQVTLTEADFYNEDGSSKITLGSGKNKVELKYDVDFEIVPGSYKNNLKKGTASVTLRGISDKANGGSGLYGGIKTIKFKIGTRGFEDWFWWLGF